jgi:hypothetical protein
MKSEMPVLSEDFQRLYCDASVFESFSALHPISFTRVLPFQADDPVVDDVRLLAAETAYLANPNNACGLAVVEAFGGCGLLSAADVANLKPVLDGVDSDFFEFMGDAYVSAGIFICALRWYRECIAKLEAQPSVVASDGVDVYASVGYCLYSLGLYAEAVAWSKSCIGPAQITDMVCRALINYETQLQGGCVRAIERCGPHARYTISAFDPEQANQLTPRLKQATSVFAPIQETYIDWISSELPGPEIPGEGYPFQAERDSTPLTRHRTNLIFSLCGQADDLTSRGFTAEAKRLLLEAAMLETRADFIQEKIKALV